jgi:hypothetical protein
VDWFSLILKTDWWKSQIHSLSELMEQETPGILSQGSSATPSISQSTIPSPDKIRARKWEHPQLQNALKQQYESGPPKNAKRLAVNSITLVLLGIFLRSRFAL